MGETSVKLVNENLDPVVGVKVELLPLDMSANVIVTNTNKQGVALFCHKDAPKVSARIEGVQGPGGEFSTMSTHVGDACMVEQATSYGNENCKGRIIFNIIKGNQRFFIGEFSDREKVKILSGISLIAV